jgi:hypothetical protein
MGCRGVFIFLPASEISGTLNRVHTDWASCLRASKFVDGPRCLDAHLKPCSDKRERPADGPRDKLCWTEWRKYSV